MKPYSIDLRERIVQAVNDDHKTAEDTAHQFKVSLASVYRYLQLHRDLQNLTPLKSTGRTRLISLEDEPRLVEQINANNDLTLAEHCQLWQKYAKQTISPTCMFESLKRAKISLKKKAIQAKERNTINRITWLLAVGLLDAKDFVFVDETGTHVAMTRRYARALKGEIAVGVVPRNYGSILTLVSALSCTGIQTQMVLDGAVNKSLFVGFVQKFLIPTLRPGQVVIMDRLSAHCGVEVRASIEAAGCQLMLLPSYSPDLNPIEFAFSWLKTFLRGVSKFLVRWLWVYHMILNQYQNHCKTSSFAQPFFQNIFMTLQNRLECPTVGG
jgi:transposase